MDPDVTKGCLRAKARSRHHLFSIEPAVRAGREEASDPQVRKTRSGKMEAQRTGKKEAQSMMQIRKNGAAENKTAREDVLWSRE